MSGVERKQKVLNVKQKLEILQKLDNGESARTDAEDVLNEGNTISHSAALQSVETLFDYMGQRGFDYNDITAVRKKSVNIRQEMNKQQKQRRITDFLSRRVAKAPAIPLTPIPAFSDKPHIPSSCPHHISTLAAFMAWIFNLLLWVNSDSFFHGVVVNDQPWDFIYPVN
ncbi:hypothetical protein AVEN_45751-1 [Araneus ventricosus]|uniref:HTH psq-type domain-containing protein n=1 Tax=Araneus ventricosus TaxID=182803 RepID=A0A4Y2LKC6_ARAVE|nr:hypothetical protein AVEN_45751-1 [Araneus ventricosus]